MANQKNNPKNNNINFLKLAFEQAKINLGSTGENPSVGCVIVKNESVVSSAFTSVNGRPHAEANALNKKINFKDAIMYVTLEPCSHYGKTSPCINKIIKKKIKKVYYCIYDQDIRTRKKTSKLLSINNISSNVGLLKKEGKDFYKSYTSKFENKIPLIDAKLAITKDFFTKNIKSKFITNYRSRKVTHLLRSRYDCLLTTSKTINDDNPELNVRIDGLEKKSPDLIIIDRNLTLKIIKRVFDKKYNRKIYIVTTRKNVSKINKYSNKNIHFIKIESLSKKNHFLLLFDKIKKLGYSRILSETGPNFLQMFVKFNFINNLYVFQAPNKIKSNDAKPLKKKIIKKMRFNKKINVNLHDNKLFKVKLANV